MWNIANTFTNLRLKKVSTEPNLCCTDVSDDDSSSSSSNEERLECPICWESFNVVDNVPYVLLCGHTLCQNCVLGLQWAVFKLPAQKIQLPFFVTCPWCKMLSFRFVYRGNLRFPRKNYSILWMVESLNGQRAKSEFSLRGYSHPALSPTGSSALECCSNNHSPWRAQSTHSQGRLGSNLDDSHVTGYVNVERPYFSLHKSLDYFVHLAAKFPLVLMFLVILVLVIPGSLTVLVLYLLVTILLVLPSFLVLIFAYPTLDWLLREITS